MTDIFNRTWIIENALDEISNYDPGVLTIRALHYRLVSRGMTNTLRHYKRVVAAMIVARWDRLVPFNTFSDHDRETLGDTPYEETTVEESQEKAEDQIRLWMTQYKKNFWENQNYYVEVWIEKKALQGIFQPVCDQYQVSLSPCKGYPSLTFLNDAADRFVNASFTHETVILYFGDYDPSGEDIPRSIKENLYKLGVNVIMDRRLLLREHVQEFNLPAAPAKVTDSRTASWDGIGQVELDAVEPQQLQDIIIEAVEEYIDFDLRNELIEQQIEEKAEYTANLKKFVKEL